MRPEPAACGICCISVLSADDADDLHAVGIDEDDLPSGSTKYLQSLRITARPGAICRMSAGHASRSLDTSCDTGEPIET